MGAKRRRATKKRKSNNAEATGASACGERNPAKLSKKTYEKELKKLQLELVKLAEFVRVNRLKVVVILEGRDAAGKGGIIKRITDALNPRFCRVSALSKPTEREKKQWYFQCYVAHLPAAGEVVLFDRSWYDRAGVERVMGFCEEGEYREFLRSCPEFESMLVRSGIILIKYWFSVSDEEQEARFRERSENPTKRWKLSPNGPRIAHSLGRILKSEGRNVHSHRHQTGALVCGRRQRQAPRPAQLHRASSKLCRVQGFAAQTDRSSAEARGRGLRPSAVKRPDIRPRCIEIQQGELVRPKRRKLIP